MGAGLSDVADFEAKYPRDGGVAGVPDPLCCQAEHWTYLRTTNLIVSPFATGATAAAGDEGGRLADERAPDRRQAAGDRAALITSLADPQHLTP